MKNRRSLAALLILALTLAGLASAQSPEEVPALPLPTSEEPTVVQKTGDVLFLRPLLAVRLVVGVALLPIAWPTAAVLGDASWVFDACVSDPADRLFRRPIGRL